MGVRRIVDRCFHQNANFIYILTSSLRTNKLLISFLKNFLNLENVIRSRSATNFRNFRENGNLIKNNEDSYIMFKDYFQQQCEHKEY